MKEDFFMPLSVNLTGKIRHNYNEKSKLPAHKLVIQPLIENCLSAFVYGLKKTDELFLNSYDILINDKGKYKFDLTKECVIGYELLWNSTSWKRGSIVIIIEKNKLDFNLLFKNTYRPGLSGTPNSGISSSATKKCREEAKNGNIAICFPASNGIEWMTIYSDEIQFEELKKLAFSICNEKDYNKRQIQLINARYLFNLFNSNKSTSFGVL